LTPLGDWATALVLAVPTEEETFSAEKSRSGYQPWPEVPPPPSRPLEPDPSEPDPSEPEDVVVVVVVEAEPLPGPELDPEEPPSEEPWPEPSLPEVVDVLLLPSLLPLVVGGTTVLASSEPLRPLPDEPSSEDVRRSPLPELDSREPLSRVCDCCSAEWRTSRPVTIAAAVGVAGRRARALAWWRGPACACVVERW